MSALTVVRNAVSRLFAVKAQPLRAVDSERGWTHLFGSGEMHQGDWQADIEIRRDVVLANWTIFASMTLISSDIGKVNLDLVRQTKDGIWVDATSSAFSPVIKKPNRYQTRQQFIEQWIVSKLSRGNTYVLKERDQRGVVIALYVLDPDLVQPLVSPDGRVFYQLHRDELSGLTEDMPAVPADEIIHDRFNCLFHPLVGLSPIFASGLAAMQGLNIQKSSAKFFKNMARPSGILTAPGQIAEATADRLKTHWESNYSGHNIGKVAVLGDDLKFQALTENAVDAELVAQLNITAQMICSTFHIPAFKIGAGTIPAGQKVEDLNQIYYADCLHALMDAIQTLLVFGLGLDTPKEGITYGVRFDLDDLLKMDSATFTSVLKEQTGSGIVKLDEARRKLNYAPMAGGNAAYLQQQNYSVEALAKRDASADPFAKATPTPAAAPAPAAEPPPTKAFEELSGRLEKTDTAVSEVLGVVRSIVEAQAARDRARELADEQRTAELERSRAGARAFAAALTSRIDEALNAA